jgi:hypothetical protein
MFRSHVPTVEVCQADATVNSTGEKSVAYFALAK